jgi:hypothetical protein
LSTSTIVGTAVTSTEVRDEDGDLIISVTEPSGITGGCRIIYVSGVGFTAEIDRSATLDDIGDLEETLASLGLDFLDYDEKGMPIPEVEAGDGVGFSVYSVVEL